MHDFFAVCPPGLRAGCLRELKALDIPVQDIQLLPGGVAFSCRLNHACLANLWLRSPARILMRIARFQADRFHILEKKLTAIDWELFLPAGTQPAIQVTTHTSRLYHSDAVAERCRPIIQAALGTTSAQNQRSPLQMIPQTVMVRAENDRFDISLDMSGIPLFKRGIKQQITQAPLRENLAFAILDAAGFTPEDPLIDPMCGAGTFAIEGAMIQAHIPPGFFRGFAFETWPGFSPAAFAHAKSLAAKHFFPAGPVFASDTDPGAVEALTANLARHPFLAPVQASRQNFFDMLPDQMIHKKGVVVLNPPYGRRLEPDQNTKNLYRQISRKLAADFKGWRVGLVFPKKHMADLNHPGLAGFGFFHGGLDLAAGIGTI
ncbi:MAG: RNA methyltransferase [Desulfobacteraceae bacterium]|nr:RNA methyltransferase [Desulfobacteraceae bacterium]